MNNKIKKLMTSSLVGMLMFSTAFPSFAGEYGSWRKFSKYPGLQYRVKCSSLKNYAGWDVQYYNGYYKTIRFIEILTKADATTPSRNGYAPWIGAGLTDIKSGKTSWSYHGINGGTCNSSVSVWIKDVSFR
jgi:hypothetical protein